MYRQTADRLCKLCPKGEFADEFGSPYCAPCPRDHTTRGLGSRAESHCYYHHTRLPDGDSQILRSYAFGPSGLKDYGSATLRCKI